MSDQPFPSAVTNVWPRTAGSTTTAPSTTGPVPLGGYNPGGYNPGGNNPGGYNPGGYNRTGLPTVNNPNLPSTIRNTGNIPPPVPQPPLTPFPSIQQPFGTNSTNTNVYAINQPLSPFNPISTNLVQNSVQAIQNQANQRRLTQLEDENVQRRNTTSTLQQVGTQLLQGQMDVQEQVLQYQFMLEQCMETLDHQNFVLNGQAEELALLRGKMRHFEYLMDSIKHSKETDQLRRSTSGASNPIDVNALCTRKLLSLYAPDGSPFFPGGVTRVTSSKFQPFNPRYRSPNGRSSNQNESRSMTPSIPNSAAANTRLSRPISNTNN